MHRKAVTKVHLMNTFWKFLWQKTTALYHLRKISRVGINNEYSSLFGNFNEKVIKSLFERLKFENFPLVGLTKVNSFQNLLLGGISSFRILFLLFGVIVEILAIQLAKITNQTSGDNTKHYVNSSVVL